MSSLKVKPPSGYSWSAVIQKKAGTSSGSREGAVPIQKVQPVDNAFTAGILKEGPGASLDEGTHRVGVSCLGNNLSLTVDDKVVIDTTADFFSTGLIGFGVESYRHSRRTQNLRQPRDRIHRHDGNSHPCSSYPPADKHSNTCPNFHPSSASHFAPHTHCRKRPCPLSDRF